MYHTSVAITFLSRGIFCIPHPYVQNMYALKHEKGVLGPPCINLCTLLLVAEKGEDDVVRMFLLQKPIVAEG